MTIVVVIPSRGRPERARQAVQAIRETAALVSTSVILAVDADDPELAGYRALGWPGDFRAECWLEVLEDDETGSLVRATNTVSMRVAAADPDAIIGNLGDDHMCRTPGWDRLITDALTTPGVAYGRDGIHDEALPTAPFISAAIVLALGYFFIPDVDHRYGDNAVRDIAEQAGVRRFLPELLTEHMHPAVGKAAWDDGYIRVNEIPAVELDKARYENWRRQAMSTDIGRVRAMLEAHRAA